MFGRIDLRDGVQWERRTDIFQHLHLCAYALEVLVVLVFELREYGVAVLSSVTATHHQPLLSSCHRSGFLFFSLQSTSSPISSPIFPAAAISSHARPFRATHVPRIRRRTPKRPIHLPHPTPTSPHAAAARSRVAISAR